MNRLYLIPPEELVSAWTSISHLMEKTAAASNGKFLVRDFIAAIVKGEFQLWVNLDDSDTPTAIMLGRIVDFPQRRVYEPIAVTADQFSEDSSAILEALGLIELWAKTNGCTLMQPWGRPAFERVLKGQGYRKTHVMLEKDL